jgi:hypothetical protein
MLEFPSTLPMPDLPLPEQREKADVWTQMENGLQTGRRKFTKRRLTITLNWTNITLTQAEYDILQTFLNNACGIRFSYIHPVTHVSYIMHVKSEDEFKWAADGNPGWSGGIVISEV